MTAPAVDLIPHQIVGHEWVLGSVQGRGDSAGGAHAFLLTGPAHMGKFTTALFMAQQFLCEQTPACGECRHCRLTRRGTHPDLRILQIPDDRKSIPVKDVHEFLQGIALKPLEASCKVYIIRGADDLTEDGANALLKTIEEPPPTVKLILTAVSPSMLLPTIVSRCQLIALHRVPPTEIADHMVAEHGIDAEEARTISLASQGLPGWAMLASKRTELLEERYDRARDLVRMLSADRIDRIRYADDLAEHWSKQPDEVYDTLDAWTDVWRDILLVQQGLIARAALAQVFVDIVSAAESLDPDAVRAALASSLEISTDLDRNAHPRLALEAHLLQLPRLRTVANASRR